MRKEKVIVPIVAVALTFFLFSLPKAAVRKSNGSVEAKNKETPVKGNSDKPFGLSLTPEAKKRAHDLAVAFTNEKSNGNRAAIADRLAKLFASFDLKDSVAFWTEKAAFEVASSDRKIATGDAYYELFLTQSDSRRREEAAQRARAWYMKVEETDPRFPDAKAKEAMTYVPADNSMPLHTVNMLRDVLAEYPENETALFNLGLLSMQSGQYEKAKERFEKIVGRYPENTKALLHLALVYKELGDVERAVKHLEKVKNQDKDSVARSTAEVFLKELKK